MRRKKIVLALLFSCFVLSGCSNTAGSTSAGDKRGNSQDLVSGSGIQMERIDASQKTDINLTAADIKSVNVLVRPSRIAKGLSKDEIKEFVSLLDPVTLGDLVDHKKVEENNGQWVQFVLQLKDGTERNMVVYNPYFILDDTTYKIEYKACEALNAFANRIVSGHTVSYDCEAGSISLNIPDGWSYKVDRYKKEKDNQTFGISFWPEQSKENKIEIQYSKFFGVCGTGLETKEIQVNGMKAEAGYYNGKKYWEYIIFMDEKYENFSVLNLCDSKKWWRQYGDQVMEILDTVKLG